MKKIGLVFSLVLFFTVSFQVNAQWYTQYNLSETFLREVNFISQDTGWVAGNWILLRTTNEGNSWDTLIYRAQSNTTIEGISFVDNLTGWYLEMDTDNNNCKIYKTINAGESWSLQNTFPTYTLLWDLLFINENNGFAVGYDLTHPVVWKTIDGGNTWNLVVVDSLSGPELYKLFFLDENNGWAVGDGIYKTVDGGSSWDLVFNSIGIADIQFTTPNIGWYTDALGLWKSTDGGINWFQQSAIGGWHNSLCFVDSDTGYFCPFNGILKTTNGGTNWTYQLLGDYNMSDICFTNYENGWALGYTPGRIFKTENGGLPVELTFFTATYSQSKVNLNWLTATELNNNGFEIEESLDKTAWKTIGFVKGAGTTSEPQQYNFVDDESNLSSTVVFYRLKQLDFDGTFEYSNTIEIEIGIPAKFSLQQNYPNPFNPSTKISWQAPVSGWQTLRVYDILGNEVATLVDEYRNAGSYNAQFTINNVQLSSGVYFYQLRVGDYLETKKMVLLK